MYCLVGCQLFRIHWDIQCIYIGRILGCKYYVLQKKKKKQGKRKFGWSVVWYSRFGKRKHGKKKKDCSYNKQWEAKKTWVICQQRLNESCLHAFTQMYRKATLAKCASNVNAFLLTTTAENGKNRSQQVLICVPYGKTVWATTTDCLVKVSAALFHDSNVVKKLQQGQTKAEMITMNFLSEDN